MNVRFVQGIPDIDKLGGFYSSAIPYSYVVKKLLLKLLALKDISEEEFGIFSVLLISYSCQRVFLFKRR